MMNILYQSILEALQQENKEKALTLSLEALDQEKLSVADLYQEILTPALAHVVEEYRSEKELIWREHVRSGIVRTIVECCYPRILEEKKKIEHLDKTVLVICPDLEDHEIGARMAADFYELAGYDTFFTGARTPLKTAIQAVRQIRPYYVVISVTNFYNFVSVKRTVDSLRKQADYPLIVITGGRAVQANPDVQAFIGADLELHTFEEIKQLSQEDASNEFSF